ncbi:unnamed protein product [Cyprideis torosa]|uniref:Uncharacterized protein n=1 Tax=Cyprideis torosa TaxID=163714 RepID=A0A7R8WN23_9CRUS|nr:unnamed protein product [Cyprideis torosa]CAG0899106.1 unnamed protein product [Cyprideis torosa]
MQTVDKRRKEGLRERRCDRPLPWPIDRPSSGYRPHGNRYNPSANCGSHGDLPARDQKDVDLMKMEADCHSI